MELKAQLEQIDELRFIFTFPTFVTEKTAMLGILLIYNEEIRYKPELAK